MTGSIITLIAAAATAGAVAPAKPAQPANNPQTWVADDDYPAEAIHAGKAGQVGVRLAVDKDGMVTGCTIVTSSGTPLLDDTTCRLLTARARFHPALDRRGRAIASTWSTRFSWRLPNIPTIATRPGFVVTTYEVQPDGHVLSCRSAGEDGKAVEDDPCNAVTRGESPSWIRKYAADYGVLQLHDGSVMLASMPPLAGPDSAVLIARRLADLSYAPDQSLVSCKLLATDGSADVRPDTCTARPVAAMTGRSGDVDNEVVDGWALYGVPRKRK